MRKRRDMETFNLSFLDVVCCGFGAVILLLVITKIYEPVTIQKSQEELQKLIVTLEQELNLIQGESTVLNQTLTEVREQVSENDELKNRLTGDLSEMQGEFTASKALADEKTAENARSLLAQCKPGEILVQKKTQKSNSLRANYAFMLDGEIKRASCPISGVVIAQQQHMPRYVWRDDPDTLEHKAPRLPRVSTIDPVVFIHALKLHRYIN